MSFLLLQFMSEMYAGESEGSLEVFLSVELGVKLQKIISFFQGPQSHSEYLNVKYLKPTVLYLLNVTARLLHVFLHAGCASFDAAHQGIHLLEKIKQRYGRCDSSEKHKTVLYVG